MFTYSSGRVISYYYPHESIFFIIKSRVNTPLVTEQLLLRQPFPLPRLTFNFFFSLVSAHPCAELGTSRTGMPVPVSFCLISLPGPTADQTAGSACRLTRAADRKD